MTRISKSSETNTELAAETSSCNTHASNTNQSTNTQQSRLVSANINLFVQLYEQRRHRNNTRGEEEDNSFGYAADADADAVADEEGLNDQENNGYETDNSLSCQPRGFAHRTDVASEDFDLRPKFAILKHKPEFIEQKDALSEARQKQSSPTTPAWFFNIPTTKSPFTDFGNKLTAQVDDDDDDDEDDIDVCH